MWLTGVFYGSLFLLGTFTLAITGVAQLPAWLIQVAPQTSPADWHELMFQLGRKAFVIVPPLWVALFANRRLNALFKLEEEYAHKTVMSRSFEGYKRELQGITDTEGPLAKHTAAVIEVLSRPPVRVLEGKHAADTPLEAIADGAVRILGASKDVIGSASEAAGNLLKHK